jgi:hypothetical protein
VAGVFAVVAVYLAIMTTVATVRDRDSTLGIKIARLAFVWLVPVLGPLLALRVLREYAPSLVPTAAIPWPLRGAVTGHPLGANPSRDDIGFGEYTDSVGLDCDSGHAGSDSGTDG